MPAQGVYAQLLRARAKELMHLSSPYAVMNLSSGGLVGMKKMSNIIFATNENNNMNTTKILGL